jgi:predicted NUDIX family NTP pyrophosphohydrolase
MYRFHGSVLEVFLVHPGGPFWAAKDEGAWSIPKGLIEPGEDHFAAAKREFEEETSIPASNHFLTSARSGKNRGKVSWPGPLNGGDAPPVKYLFTIEWPPRSGLKKDFPEIDKGGFFALPEARRKINKSQGEFLDRLETKLARRLGISTEL